MVIGLLAPRNETEFKKELRLWFLSGKTQHRAYCTWVTNMSGKPDMLFGWHRPDGMRQEFWVEAKYVSGYPRSMQTLWNLLRGNQRVTMTKMAAAGFDIYLVVCIGGKESDWYKFDPGQCFNVLKGKAHPWSVMYHAFTSVREPTGKWKRMDPQQVDRGGKVLKAPSTRPDQDEKNYRFKSEGIPLDKFLKEGKSIDKPDSPE